MGKDSNKPGAKDAAREEEKARQAIREGDESRAAKDRLRAAQKNYDAKRGK